MTNSGKNQVETHIEISIENRNRATVFFRPLLVLPVFAFIWLFDQFNNDNNWSTLVLGLPVAAAMVFRNVYPSWLLSFNHAALEFSTRLGAYALLLTDDYPTFERNPKVAVIFPDVEGGKKLNRWLPLVKWFLAIPLYIVGAIYTIIAVISWVIAWIQTSITGRFPSWASANILGVIRFWNRVIGYAVALVSDEYPSFSLS
jgi:hypothetical protein